MDDAHRDAAKRPWALDPDRSSGLPVGESFAPLVALRSSVGVGLCCACTSATSAAAFHVLGPDVVDVSAFGEVDAVSEVEWLVGHDWLAAPAARLWE